MSQAMSSFGRRIESRRESMLMRGSQPVTERRRRRQMSEGGRSPLLPLKYGANVRRRILIV